MHGQRACCPAASRRGGLLLHTLYFENELHRAKKASAPKTSYTAKELQLAKSLVEHLRAPFKPEQFHDTYRESVEHLRPKKGKARR